MYVPTNHAIRPRIEYSLYYSAAIFSYFFSPGSESEPLDPSVAEEMLMSRSCMHALCRLMIRTRASFTLGTADTASNRGPFQDANETAAGSNPFVLIRPICTICSFHSLIPSTWLWQFLLLYHENSAPSVIGLLSVTSQLLTSTLFLFKKMQRLVAMCICCHAWWCLYVAVHRVRCISQIVDAPDLFDITVSEKLFHLMI